MSTHNTESKKPKRADEELIRSPSKKLKTNNINNKKYDDNSNIKNKKEDKNNKDNNTVTNTIGDNIEKKKKKNQSQDGSVNNKRWHPKKSVYADRFIEDGEILKVRLQKQEELIKKMEEDKIKVEMLLEAEPGFLEAEDDEKTVDFEQRDIAHAVDIRAARKAFELNLDVFGPYSIDYTKNGRFLLLGGNKGHIALVDWNKFELATEFHVKEAIRDVKFLHNETMFVAAQKQYSYIYDRQGTELHCLKYIADPILLEFLPYHFLLVVVDSYGKLAYQDVSTGQVVATLRTKLGAPHSMRQNPRNAIIVLGHNDGCVTLWSPNAQESLVKMLCHRSPVTNIAVDISGQYMVTSGMDNRIKIWDIRTYQQLFEHRTHNLVTCLDISQRRLLGVGTGGIVHVWKDVFHSAEHVPYLKHRVHGNAVHRLRFCPYEDVLGIGHDKGFSSMIVPGAGEPNFDTFEADPLMDKRRRREAEVHALLEKIPADMITVDPDIIGKFADKGTFASSACNEVSHPGLINLRKTQLQPNKEQLNIIDREKKRQMIREKIEKEQNMRNNEGPESGTSAALDRFVGPRKKTV